MRLAVVLALLLPCLARCEPASATLEMLLREAWSPLPVRVQWAFSGPLPTTIEQHSGWILAEPRPTRLAGAVIVTLERRLAEGGVERVAVSGTARVFGPSLSARSSIPAGALVDPAELDSSEAEWTCLNGEAAQRSQIIQPMQAARGLVPGRTIITRDLKPALVVHRGQPVDLQYADGSVRVILKGQALQNGAAGDRITVAVNMGTTRHFKGTVTKDGAVLFAR
jgi:flagella basal body P-ring formation protein FlgA